MTPYRFKGYPDVFKNELGFHIVIPNLFWTVKLENKMTTAENYVQGCSFFLFF